MSKQEIERLIRELEKLDSGEGLALLADLFPGEAVFSTSFGKEDQVILNQIYRKKLDIEVFTLDTGRLFPETYALWSRSLERFKVPIKAYYPSADLIGKYVEQNGPNGFYQSKEQRLECCFIRKVEPLQRALKGKKLWVTGIRAQQSANRENFFMLEWDEKYSLLKYHPLLHWTEKQVDDHIQEYHVPYNSLHDKGFPSIGCAPCTRSVADGEDPRSGRWWWEQTNKRECGLHAN